LEELERENESQSVAERTAMIEQQQADESRRKHAAEKAIARVLDVAIEAARELQQFDRPAS
jgi:hypothetical protein